MFKGATGKRVFYFTSAMLRTIVAVGLLIAYIIVKFTVKPSIVWLNTLLIVLAVAGIISALYNLAMCGMPATGYKTNKGVQIGCLIFTCLTGGILSSIFTGFAVFTKVLPEDVKNERIFNTKNFKRGE